MYSWVHLNPGTWHFRGDQKCDNEIFPPVFCLQQTQIHPCASWPCTSCSVGEYCHITIRQRSQTGSFRHRWGTGSGVELKTLHNNVVTPVTGWEHIKPSSRACSHGRVRKYRCSLYERSCSSRSKWEEYKHLDWNNKLMAGVSNTSVI